MDRNRYRYKQNIPSTALQSVKKEQSKFRLRSITRYIGRKKVLLIYSLVAILIIAGASYGLAQLTTKKPVHKSIPPFTPVVPIDENQLAHLGKKDYDAAHNSYTFFDYYLALPLQVSEQPLPSGHGSVVRTVKEAASAFQASMAFNTTLNGVAYITTKPAPAKQIVIFSEKGLLIFLESSYIESTSFWNEYINTLQ